MPAGDLRGWNPAFRFMAHLPLGKACVALTLTIPSANTTMTTPGVAITITKPSADIQIEVCDDD